MAGLVLVHGNPETAAIWQPLIEVLGVAGAETLSPPGFGAPVPDGFGVTADDYATISERLRRWVRLQAAKIWRLTNAAAAALRRAWYVTAIACPAEPGAFVVQARSRRYTAGPFRGNERWWHRCSGAMSSSADRTSRA
jgi:hypothetical protein